VGRILKEIAATGSSADREKPFGLDLVERNFGLFRFW